MADLFDELKAKGGRGVMPAPQRMFGDVARKGTGEKKKKKKEKEKEEKEEKEEEEE